jgi:G3E family GTPase
MAAQAPVPVTILSGFLGSGKTSLLKHLLRSRPGGRFGLVVNDVGAVNVDARDLEHNFPEGDGTIQLLSELTQGCICCSIGDELADALVYLWEKSRPAHIIIEASGVANPRNILQTFYTQNFAGHSLLEVFRISNLVTVVDAAHFLKAWRHTLGDRSRRRHIFLNDPRRPYLELMMEQVETCDVLVLNKQDLVSSAERMEVDQIFADLNPRAERWRAEEGRIETDHLLGTDRFELQDTQRGGRIHHFLENPHGESSSRQGTHAAHQGYGLTTVVFRARRPARSKDLFRVLRSELPGVVRAKGFYWTSDEPEQCGILSLAGGVLRADRAGPWFIDLLRHGLADKNDMPPQVRAAWEPSPLGDRRQEIVLIGVDLDKQEICSRLGACLEAEPAPRKTL